MPALAVAAGAGLISALLLTGIARGAMIPLQQLLLLESPEVGPGRAGTATGLFFTVGEVGGFGGPFVIGLLLASTGQYLVPLLSLGAVMAASAVVALTVRESGGARRLA
jgi:nitrate/nitrite transporter NarK